MSGSLKVAKLIKVAEVKNVVKVINGCKSLMTKIGLIVYTMLFLFTR